MDLFTGKKIAELRKFNSLSQESLAEKVGVSRQAISKWERGEASPDMENVVSLARIFNVTVDDLLGDKKASEITDFSALKTPQPEVAQPPATAAAPAVAEEKAISETPVKEEHAETKKEKKLKPRYKPQTAKMMNRIPVFILVPIIFVLLGITLQLWHPAWLMFFILPIYYLTAFAFNAKDRRGFFLRLPVPFVIIALFLLIGFATGAWHPAWMMFFILPVYYWAAAMVKR